MINFMLFAVILWSCLSCEAHLVRWGLPCAKFVIMWPHANFVEAGDLFHLLNEIKSLYSENIFYGKFSHIHSSHFHGN
jgi:hypothetical protein